MEFRFVDIELGMVVAVKFAINDPRIVDEEISSRGLL